jgi:GTP-binding protein
LRAIRFAEVVILLIDAGAPFEKQDLTIADLIAREGRGLVIGYNKWDLVKDHKTAHSVALEKLDRLLPQVRGAPLVPLSGEKGRGLKPLMNSAFDVYDLWNRRVSTAALNRCLERATERHPPPASGGRRVRIRYITQVKARPPTFAAFTTRPDDLPDSYTRYFINSIRDEFDIPAVPIRLFWRKRENPYVKDK